MRVFTSADFAKIGFTVDGAPVTAEALTALAPCCCLCRAPAAIGALYVPYTEHEPALIAMTRRPKRAGKRRAVVYGLCQACAAIPGVEDRCEELLFDEATT